MESFFRKCTLAAALALAGVCGSGIAAQSTAGSAAPTFSLKLTAAAPVVKSGDPVWVEVTMTNTSDHKIPVFRAKSPDGDQGGWVYEAKIHNQKGAEPPETEAYPLMRDGIKGGGGRKLDPGDSLKDRVNISKLFDLSKPGKYTIQLRRLDPEKQVMIDSNQVVVKVRR